ncbi:MAG: hypothetical protein EOO59_12670 [Hymenobacter sp.]|nr:MAG: hypothetical protein EOO59_12670 [Hymenobacter sp.]
MDDLSDLYARHAAFSLEKQLALGHVIGTRSFAFDAEAGTLSFGEGRQFPMQLLGTVSRQSNTWLWAWASPQPAPPALLRAARQLQALGQRLAIAELEEEGFDLVTPAIAGLAAADDPDYAPDPLDGHYMAMLAAGECQASAYYGADYGRGIAYVLLPQVPAVQAQLSDEPAHLAAVFAQLLQLPYAFDHRAALGAYLEQKGYTVAQADYQLRGQKKEHWLEAAFDSTGRLNKLETSGGAVA